jgi:hypothetical protein
MLAREVDVIKQEGKRERKDRRRGEVKKKR